MKALQRSEHSLAAHARFLQFVFRRTRDRASHLGRGRVWTRGGLAWCFPMWRPVHGYRCHSSGVASESEFEAQAAEARRVLDWYACYVRVLARLMGRTPGVVSGFCGAGGSDEGVRRGPGRCHTGSTSRSRRTTGPDSAMSISHGETRGTSGCGPAPRLSAGRSCERPRLPASRSRLAEWESRRSPS